MRVVHEIDEMHRIGAEVRRAGKTIGFVPTMGALHAGHASLIDLAASRTDIRVVSIFVNPTQFGPNEDYEKYPRTLERDCEIARAHGCDIVFAPDAAKMYPATYGTSVEVTGITSVLCGASRPGHFRGVATVVTKLFNIVGPDFAVFGQKDAQQVLVIRRMVRDLNMPVELIIGPTVRESDGLAMSSRNRYLTPAERTDAPALYAGLMAAHAAFDQGERDVERLIAAAREVHDRAPLLSIEYLEVVDTVDLQPLLRVTDKALMAVAARTTESRTRLIDNVVLGGEL